ncbi:hypothetical protein PTKIN_Ptkin02bG0031800 [Pterospermum kingtungense]
MAKSFIFLIMALLLLRVTAQSRPLSTPHSHTPVSSPESSLIGDDGCKSMDGDEECLIRRSLAAHTDYIYTQENDSP